MPGPGASRLELIAQRAQARRHARDVVERRHWARVQYMLANDPELMWVRQPDPIGLEEPYDSADEGIDPEVPQPCAVVEIDPEHARPAVKKRKLPPRRWLPMENRRVQLRVLGMTPKTYEAAGCVTGHLSAKDLEALERDPRPTTRGQCEPGSPGRWWGDEPCPYKGCQHNLGIHVSAAGSIRVVLGLRDGRGSCALDVAANGEHTLEQVAETEGCTREAVRLVEQRALANGRRRVE